MVIWEKRAIYKIKEKTHYPWVMGWTLLPGVVFKPGTW
jgi:hypothetical protein